MPEHPTTQIEYLKLWNEQSKLFWSRLQTATVLHSGVLAGWYKLRQDNSSLQFFLLLIGSIVTMAILIIMYRDDQYMDKLRDLAGEYFPKVDSTKLGRRCGYFIVGSIAFVELVIFALYLLMWICKGIRCGVP